MLDTLQNYGSVPGREILLLYGVRTKKGDKKDKKITNTSWGTIYSLIILRMYFVSECLSGLLEMKERIKILFRSFVFFSHIFFSQKSLF